MPTITRDGVKLAYEERGSGTPTLVFVHGWCCDRSFFAPQAEHFARRHRVVSVDLRGHGQSDKPRGAYPIAQFADDVAHTIDTLGLGKVVAVGHSMGGATVLQLAATYPDRVAAIVMVDPAPLRRSPDREVAITMLIEQLDAGKQELQERMITEFFFLRKSDSALVARVRDLMLATPTHVAAAAMRGILGFNGVALAARVTAPALHIAATPPLNQPQQMTEWLPDVVNGMTVGAGHFNQLEAPAQVTGMIEGFLRHHV